jgi:hypothetical protein
MVSSMIFLICNYKARKGDEEGRKEGRKEIRKKEGRV